MSFIIIRDGGGNPLHMINTGEINHCVPSGAGTTTDVTYQSGTVTLPITIDDLATAIARGDNVIDI